MRGPEICPPGAKIAAAEVLARPQHFTVVLCPELLTQAPGKHKMFATLSGVELTNTRHGTDVNGDTVPEDRFAWIDMSIDDLRQEVLSVYLGLIIMYIQGVKFEKKIIDDEGNTVGSLNSKAKPKYILLDSVRLTIIQSEDHLITILTPQGIYQRIRL